MLFMLIKFSRKKNKIVLITSSTILPQWAKLVSWKLECESTNKSSKLTYCQFCCRWIDAVFLINFCVFSDLIDYYFFWVNDETKIFHFFGWYELSFIWMYYKAQFLKQFYCFYHSKETFLKALIYSNPCILCILSIANGGFVSLRNFWGPGDKLSGKTTNFKTTNYKLQINFRKRVS